MHISDKRALKQFFEDNLELTTPELAIALAVSVSTVVRWKKECGMDIEPPPDMSYIKRKKKVQRVPQEIWDRKEWFEEQYKIYGSYTIARMIGKSTRLVHKRLVRFNIETRSHEEAVRSTNKYCTEEWLDSTYGRGMSLRKCAAIAGVSLGTIRYWLIKFGKKPRDPYHAGTKNTMPRRVSKKP